MGPEKRFETKLKKYIRDSGGWCVKFFANMYTEEGIPDLLCCINGKFLAIEVKSDNGTTNDMQDYKLELIRRAGGIAAVAAPKNFDEIKNIIKQIKEDN